VSKLVSVCGVDGAGKSTLISGLKKILPENDYKYIHITKAPLSEKVISDSSRVFNDERDWFSGKFSQKYSLACAKDFINHYIEKIEPLFINDKTIICDRYDICFKAYLEVTGNICDFKKLFGIIRKPDLVIYLDTDDELLEKRYRECKGSIEDFDSIDRAKKFRQAYEKIFEIENLCVVRMHNNGSLESLLKKASIFINNQ
jgi:dTMP kinase